MGSLTGLYLIALSCTELYRGLTEVVESTQSTGCRAWPDSLGRDLDFSLKRNRPGGDCPCYFELK